MFTGIIETVGKLEEVSVSNSNRVLWITSPISKELKVDQSVSHNGVCLTVEEVREQSHRVTAIAETLKKTNLGSLEKGARINLERCLLINSRLDGHFVQGHVDATGVCVSKTSAGGSWNFRFRFSEDFAPLVIEKGSISLNGISLTIFDVSRTEFSVSIIPYTYEHTNIANIDPGKLVNLEFDMIGKHIYRLVSLHKESSLISHNEQIS